MPVVFIGLLSDVGCSEPSVPGPAELHQRGKKRYRDKNFASGSHKSKRVGRDEGEKIEE
jgi:hypothetical protein